MRAGNCRLRVYGSAIYENAAPYVQVRSGTVVTRWSFEKSWGANRAWKKDGDRIKCKWMEIVADRTTHKFAGRTEIACEIQVNIDTFNGTETVSVFDLNGVLTEGPTSPTSLAGKRVTFP